MAKPPTHKTPERASGGASRTSGNIHVAQRTEIWSGPLPPPTVLQQYDDIHTGFAERLLRLTEEEAQHRRRVTVRAQRYEIFEATMGQLFGLLVALAAFGTAAWLGFLGHPTAAATVGGTTIAGLVGVFVAGRERPEPEAKSRTR